jgi:hypothetical protein
MACVGEGVPELVRMDVWQAGGEGGAVDQSGGGVPVELAAVGSWDQPGTVAMDVVGTVVGDQLDQVGVQRDVAVVVQLADRDVQPVPGADLDYGIRAQGDELADPKAGAEQDFADDTDGHLAVRLGRAQQPRCGVVVEGLGQATLLPRQVAEQQRHTIRRFGPAPFLDADEEHPQMPEPVRHRVRLEAVRLLARAHRQPRLVALDVGARHGSDGGDVGIVLGEEGGEAAQREVGSPDTARPQRAADLGDEAAHRVDHDRPARFEVDPPQQRCWRAHRAPPIVLAGCSANTWASIASAARRYWPASQSSARCR